MIIIMVLRINIQNTKQQLKCPKESQKIKSNFINGC
jgi:hypothetical protein